MMNYKRLGLLLGLSFCLTSGIVSCASAPPPTSLAWGGDFPLLSVTRNKPPKGKLKSLGGVSAKVCTTDGEITKRIGILDSLVRSAQKSKNADYIASAKVTRTSDFCAALTGKAVTDGAGGGAAESPESETKEEAKPEAEAELE